MTACEKNDIHTWAQVLSLCKKHVVKKHTLKVCDLFQREIYTGK